MPIEKTEHFHNTEMFKPKINMDLEMYKRQNKQIENDIKSKDPIQLVRFIDSLEGYSKKSNTIKKFKHELKKIYNYLMKELKNKPALLENYEEATSHNLKVTTLLWGELSPYYEDIPRARALSAYESIHGLLFPPADSSRRDEIDDLTQMKKKDHELQRHFDRIEAFFKKEKEEAREISIAKQVISIEKSEMVEIYKNLLLDGNTSLTEINENLGKILWDNSEERHKALSKLEKIQESCLKSMKKFEKALQYENPDIATYTSKFKESIEKIKTFQKRIKYLADKSLQKEKEQTNEVNDTAGSLDLRYRYQVEQLMQENSAEILKDKTDQREVKKSEESLNENLENFKKNDLKQIGLEDIKEEDDFLNRLKYTNDAKEFIEAWRSTDQQLNNLQSSDPPKYASVYEYRNKELRRSVFRYIKQGTTIQELIRILKECNKQINSPGLSLEEKTERTTSTYTKKDVVDKNLLDKRRYDFELAGFGSIDLEQTHKSNLLEKLKTEDDQTQFYIFSQAYFIRTKLRDLRDHDHKQFGDIKNINGQQLRNAINKYMDGKKPVGLFITAINNCNGSLNDALPSNQYKKKKTTSSSSKS